MVGRTINWSNRARMLTRLFCVMLLAAGAAGANPTTGAGPAIGAQTPLASMPQVTRVVVHKAARRMDLMNGGQVLRSYRVSLGLQPQGAKEREGDFRTPEGRYYLARRNPRSDFFLSIQVSYPNERDARRAKANGWEPGGA